MRQKSKARASHPASSYLDNRLVTRGEQRQERRGGSRLSRHLRQRGVSGFCYLLMACHAFPVDHSECQRALDRHGFRYRRKSFGSRARLRIWIHGRNHVGIRSGLWFRIWCRSGIGARNRRRRWCLESVPAKLHAYRMQLPKRRMLRCPNSTQTRRYSQRWYRRDFTKKETASRLRSPIGCSPQRGKARAEDTNETEETITIR
jgi:hypothetical protein